ncbi:MAG: serine hydrolase domain-containing protein [Gemmatimonadaceae bacterium]
MPNDARGLQHRVTRTGSTLRSITAGSLDFVFRWPFPARRLLLVNLALVTWSGAVVLPAQVTSTRSASPAPGRFDALERVISTDMRNRGIPGIAVTIVEGDEVAYRRAFGIADIESGAAMSTQLLTQVGSVTKVATALMAIDMQLAGEVDLDAPIQRYVSGLSPRIGALTLRRLLSQTSGLRDEPADSGRQDPNALLEYARSVPDAAQVLPAGEAFSYSNLGFALGGLALQEAGRAPFDQLLRDRVLRPLLMGQATMRLSDAATYPRAAGHAPDSTGRLRIVRPIANDTRYWPAGYLWASAEDLTELVRLFLRTSVRASTPRLAAAADSLMVSRTNVEGLPDSAQYGFGMFIDRWHGVRRVWHPGSMPGYSALIEILPERGVGVVVVANRDGLRLDAIAERALESVAVLPNGGTDADSLVAAPVSSTLLQSLEGRYTGRFSLDLTYRDGQLFLTRFGTTLPVVTLGGDRYAVRVPGAPRADVFKIVPAAGSRPAYIEMFLWAFPRVRR